MNTTRLLKFFFVTALMIAALVALQACTTAVTAGGSGQSPIGMGDLHRFKAQQASSPSHSGMGDLHRFEGQASIAETAKTNNPSYAGMGDLHRLEAQASNSSYSGMGDLHRFETGQEVQYAGESSPLSP